MKRLLSLFALLATVSWSAWADQTITVAANSEDISQALDLKAVATLFGTVKNVEEFETLLNNPDSAFTNLDLNGDGVVDYLRVVETSSDNKHLVVIQAVLAKDVFQDVASIYVEKDETTGQVSTQVIGDEYVYGTNYIIEPVYIYRPYIYDWFWDPFWTCWASPWYWGYYPHWWHGWACCPYDHYWAHCYHWHHCHPYCSFRYAARPRPAYHDMRHTVARREYATAHRDRSFESRNAGLTNARSVDVSRRGGIRGTEAGITSRRGSTTPTRVGNASVSSRRGTDNTFGSTGVRRSTNTTRSAANGASVARRGEATGSRSASVSTRSASAGTRTASTGTRSASVSTRSAATGSRTSTASRPAATTSRSSGSYSSSRSSGSSSRSSYSSPSRSSSSSASRSSSSRSSYSGGSSRSSYSSGSSRSSYSGGGSHSSSGGSSRSTGSTRR